MDSVHQINRYIKHSIQKLNVYFVILLVAFNKMSYEQLQTDGNAVLLLNATLITPKRI